MTTRLRADFQGGIEVVAAVTEQLGLDRPLLAAVMVLTVMLVVVWNAVLGAKRIIALWKAAKKMKRRTSFLWEEASYV